MKLGFVGTGTITDAMVRGLLASDLQIEAIHLSPRNADFVSGLAKLSNKVSIAADNQGVVDAADTVILAIRPQIAESVISDLTFRPHQKIISVVATIPSATIATWMGLDLPVIRAIPLPFVAQRQGVTAIFPPDAHAATLFDAIGTAVEVGTLTEFDLLAAASTLMGTYFGLLETASEWLVANGLHDDAARAYLSGLFRSLGETALHESGKSFATLRHEHSTPGGLNEQVHRDFAEKGGSAALASALDGVMARIRGR